MDSLIEKNKEALLAQRYCFPIPQLMYAMKEGRMKWADGKKAKEILDAAILSLLGEKTEADLAAMAESKKKGKKEAKKEVKTDLPAVEKEKEGFEGRDMESSKNSAELIAEHQKITGGKIRCRFPPEPNGYLHIGHAKSMYLNFKGAFERVGKPGETILRFDDTNPEAEKLEFIDNIMEDVKWLGWNPVKINFASDNFDKLYEYAVQLIKMGKAYVDHQTPEEIKRSREIAQECSREGGRKGRNGEAMACRSEPGESVAQPIGGGESPTLRGHAPGQVRGGRSDAANEDRHAKPEPLHVGPRRVPNQIHPAPSCGR